MAFNLTRLLSHLVRRETTFLRRYESTAVSKEGTLDLSEVSTVPELPSDINEKKLMEMRNKSRLNKSDRNILYNKRPYNTSLHFYHNTVRYKKRLLGRYGMNAVDGDIGVMWPTPEEVADAKEYERVAYPNSLQEEWEIIRMKKKERAEEMRKRDEEIAAKVAKNDKWISDLQAKIKQKEQKLHEAKQVRARVIEEVKRELNMSSVNLFDPNVLALVEKKEKEHRKKLREEKRKKYSKVASPNETSEKTKG